VFRVNANIVEFGKNRSVYDVRSLRVNRRAGNTLAIDEFLAYGISLDLHAQILSVANGAAHQILQ
jgi:hypothetical protein